MISTQPFGRTGFESTRILFGAAALAGMRPARVETRLACVERFGINHIDTAIHASPHFSWSEPIREPDALARSVRWVLAREGAFPITSSDGRLLEPIAEVAAALGAGSGAPDDVEMSRDVAAQGIEALFVRGVSDGV